MKNAFFLFLILIFWQEHSFAQQKTFINHTELGPMVGRVKISENNFDQRINFSFQTFNGARIDKYHAVGFLVGFDTYPNFNLIPLAFGWRGFWDKGKRSTPFAGLDLGKGSAILEKKDVNEWSENWYEGGFLFSPSIGIRRKGKKGKNDFTWSLGYKRQQAFFYEGFRDFSNSNNAGTGLPPGFSSIREEAYIFNSLIFKWGLIF